MIYGLGRGITLEHPIPVPITRESQEKTVAQLNHLEAKINNLQESIRAECKAEQEKLMEKVEAEQAKHDQEIINKLEVQDKRVTAMINQVKDNTERELVGEKRKIDELNKHVCDELVQLHAITAEFNVQIIEYKSDVEERMDHINEKVEKVHEKLSEKVEGLQKRVGETAELVKSRVEKELSVVQGQYVQLKATVNNMKEKMMNQVGQINENITNDPIPPSPTTATINSECHTNVVNGNSSACNLPSCNMCMNENESVGGISGNVRQNTVHGHHVHPDFTIPLFDASKDMNPVFHIRQLDEYMTIKAIPPALQLSIAYKSLTGILNLHLAQTIRHNLKDYGAFRSAFLQAWWSVAEQSLVRCRLYQSKYDPKSDLSLSAHFLKHATAATYLDPKPTDREVIEAVRFHYETGIQRAMLTANLNTVPEAFDLLRRIEVMEFQSGFHPRDKSPKRFTNDSDRRYQNHRGPNNNYGSNNNNRHDQRNVRNTWIHRDNNNQRRSRSRDDQRGGYVRSMENDARRSRLNPDAPNFRSHSERNRDEGPRRNASPRLENE